MTKQRRIGILGLEESRGVLVGLPRRLRPRVLYARSSHGFFLRSVTAVWCRARGAGANAVPAPSRGWRRGDSTDFSQKPFAAPHAPGFHSDHVEVGSSGPMMKSFTLPEFAQNTEVEFAGLYTQVGY